MNTLTIYRPYYESINVGSPLSGALIDGYRYVHYSSPLDVPIQLWGFNANFANVNVRVQLSDMSERDVWTPFFSTQMTAVFGSLSQAQPVLYLPEPYILKPGHKVQFLIQNLSGGSISQTFITLAGVRMDTVEVDPLCSN